MAAFTFNLETVLTHRRNVEDERQKALAKLLREKMILENQLRDMQATISQDKSTMTGSLIGKVDVDRIRQHARHATQVTQRAQQIAVRMVGLMKQIEQSRRALLDASRNRKAMELLRERRHERWQRMMARRETAALDEIAVQAFGRKKLSMGSH